MSSIKTKLGREKIAKAHSGSQPIVPIKKVAFGTGGVLSNGSPKSLTGNEISLFNKVIEKDAVISYPNATSVRYAVTLDAVSDKLEGKQLSEAGLIDADGTLIAMKTFTSKGMEQGVTIEFSYDVEY